MNTVLKGIALVLVVVVTACSSHDDVHVEEAVTYSITRPLRMDTSIVQEYVCQIQAIQHIELRALERGYLEKVLVNEGQRITKGQLMFQIMPTIYQAEYQRYSAEARVAEIEYKNTKALNDSNVVSKNELALAKARLDKANAEMSLAKAHLDFAQIRAPFTGIMDRLQVRHGSLLDEGDVLTALSDNTEMWVYFNVPEAQYLNYRERTKGDSLIKVQLRMANNQVFAHDGMVTTIEADFNNETGNIAFRATFPNPEGLLRHGETGNILMYEPIKNALLIPQQATFEVLDKKYVYVIGNDNVVRSKQITILAELPHLYAVKDGLVGGEKILLEGLRKVKENEKIKFKEVAPEVAIKSMNSMYAE